MPHRRDPAHRTPSPTIADGERWSSGQRGRIWVHHIGPFSLLRSRNSFASSQIGGIRETQELVGFCALHGIRPEITKISMSGIDDAWRKVVEKEARYRFVVDMTNT